MTLTNEELTAAQCGPVTIEAGGREYIVISKEVYDKATSAFDDGPSPLGTARMIRETMAEDDANDDALELYQHFKRGT